MIAAIIVLGSGALALAFSIAWLTKPGLRRQIESPKHALAARLQHYERARLDSREPPSESADERA